MNGVRSRTSSTSAQMFPQVTAAFFLMSIARSRKPRMITGRITANEGASMEFTNVVSISRSRHSSVSLCGDRIALITNGSIPRISAFFTQRQIGAITASATAVTLGCVSNTVSRNAGKISGSVRMKYPGTRVARSPHTPSAPTLLCHALCSSAATSAGASSFIAVTGSAFTTAAMAVSAPCRTSAFASPRIVNTTGASVTAEGSNCRPAVRQQCAYSAKAPARASASFLFVIAAVAAAVTPVLFAESPPRPFKRPATDAAAARRAAASPPAARAFALNDSTMTSACSSDTASARSAAERDAAKLPSSPSDPSAFRTRRSAASRAASPAGKEVAARWP